MNTRRLALLTGNLLLLSGVAAHAVTFDFRPTDAGGNVGEFFDSSAYGQVTLEGITVEGSVTLPLGGGVFNYNNNSRFLGIGISSPLSGDRPTQVDVGEGLQLQFGQRVQLLSLTLQVFFLTADNGLGGPVSQEDDAVDITLGGQTINVASPLEYHSGDPTTYTIDFSALGFSSTIMDPGDTLALAPTAGDGLRVQSITVTPVPEPATYAALFGLGLCGFVGVRRVLQHKKKASLSPA